MLCKTDCWCDEKKVLAKTNHSSDGTVAGLEKSFLCQSQNCLGYHFSGRIFFHLGRNRAPRLKSLGSKKKKKKKLSLRPSSAHTRTRTVNEMIAKSAIDLAGNSLLQQLLTAPAGLCQNLFLHKPAGAVRSCCDSKILFLAIDEKQKKKERKEKETTRKKFGPLYSHETLSGRGRSC